MSIPNSQKNLIYSNKKNYPLTRNNHNKWCADFYGEIYQVLLQNVEKQRLRLMEINEKIQYFKIVNHHQVSL